MKLPVPVAGLVAGTLLLGGIAAAATALVAEEPTPLQATAASSSADDGSTSSSTSSSSTSTPGGLDVSGPCDEAEHAGDPRCAGVPIGADDDDAPASPTAPAPAPNGDLRSFAAADGGVVSYRVDGTGFRLVAATPADGWSVEVEQASGDELDLDFRRGTVRVQVDVEREDGQVHERVRVRDDATDDRSESEVFVGTPADPAPPAPPATVDDDGGDIDRDDRTEPGDDRDDDDRSGPSDDDSDDSGDDDDDADDDDDGDDDDRSGSDRGDG